MVSIYADDTLHCVHKTTANYILAQRLLHDDSVSNSNSDYDSVFYLTYLYPVKRSRQVIFWQKKTK